MTIQPRPALRSSAATPALLTHTPEMRANYYGERALAALHNSTDLRLHEGAEPLDADALVRAARGCRIVVADRQTPVPATVFARLPDLIAVCRVAVDIRNIDVGAASTAGVLVTQASRGFVPAVAEWIVGAMVDAGRHLTDYTTAYRAGASPTAIVGRQLCGATLGVVGYGAIAEHLCRIALALGMRVLVADPYRTAAPPLEATDAATLLSQSDYVVPLAVATAETENLIDDAALARMKPSAWLINASRGNLIDEVALERALDRKLIAGAVLDVGRAPDQMPSPKLARRRDVIATPHIAGLTPEAIEHQAIETTRQVAALIRGEIPGGAVNTDKAARLAYFKGAP